MTSRESTLIKGKVVIIGASQHPHAVRRLKKAWPGVEWIDALLDETVPDDVVSIALYARPEKPEGAYSLEVSGHGVPKIRIEGGPFSGVIYGVEELIQRKSIVTASGVSLTICSVDAAPALTHRTFWTWDHSTNWELSQIGHQETGVFNPYGKPPLGFLADYKRMVDFCSASQIAAIVVYGFLRDAHGGVAAAQELCQYATERGVRILPGIAIGAYGGVYWEGKHQYNLTTWLRQNPSYASDMDRDIGFQIQDLSFPLSFPHSDYTLSACPSEPANMAWMEDAVSWLVETFDIGGINIESGDYGVCACSRCNIRRSERESAARRNEDTKSWSHADLADNYPRLFRAATAKRSDLWLYCELQWDNLLGSEAHGLLESLPDDGIYQHTINRSYWNRVKAELTSKHVASLPTNHNVLRCQFASQWNGDERTERYALNGSVFAELARKATEVGMEGLTVWGEASPHHVSVELNYLSFGRFSYDPDLRWETFKTQEIDTRLGGSAAADEFMSILEEMDMNQVLPVNRLKELHAKSIDGIGNVSVDAAGRWVWLADRLTQRLSMGA